jgi:DNA replication protein DnaC
MTSSANSTHIWQNDYKDLVYRFISDDDADLLYDKYPKLRNGYEVYCPTCNGQKHYLLDGQDVSCNCREQVQLHKHYLVSNIGLLYQRLDWNDYQGDSKARQLAELYLTNHKEMIRTGMGLIYLGPFGTGKTMLVSLVAKELTKLGYTVFFTTFAEMIDLFTKSWSSNAARARFESKVVESEIFILDDVGKEFRTKNNLAESTFDHVLRQRAVDARPTLLTTNMSEAELDEGYGGAIFSLLKERSILHHSSGEDWRSKARERTLEEVLRGGIRPIV